MGKWPIVIQEYVAFLVNPKNATTWITFGQNAYIIMIEVCRGWSFWTIYKKNFKKYKKKITVKWLNSMCNMSFDLKPCPCINHLTHVNCTTYLARGNTLPNMTGATWFHESLYYLIKISSSNFLTLIKYPSTYLFMSTLIANHWSDWKVPPLCG